MEHGKQKVDLCQVLCSGAQLSIVLVKGLEDSELCSAEAIGVIIQSHDHEEGEEESKGRCEVPHVMGVVEHGHTLAVPITRDCRRLQPISGLLKLIIKQCVMFTLQQHWGIFSKHQLVPNSLRGWFHPQFLRWNWYSKLQ